MCVVTFVVTMYAQVLVLTHELASIEEIMPYHNIRLAPMPVVEMIGRSRSLDPTCPRDASVFHWWKEREHARATQLWTCARGHDAESHVALSFPLPVVVLARSCVASCVTRRVLSIRTPPPRSMISP